MKQDNSTPYTTNNILLIKYLKSSINGLYKILPLKEEDNKDLIVYIKSLKIDLVGNQWNFVQLRYDADYLRVINILNYFVNNDFDIKTCKREVFKSIRIIQKIIQQLEKE